jgi:hypothetical protein
VCQENAEPDRVHEGDAPEIDDDHLGLLALDQLEPKLERPGSAQVHLSDQLEVRHAVMVLSL